MCLTDSILKNFCGTISIDNEMRIFSDPGNKMYILFELYKEIPKQALLEGIRIYCGIHKLKKINDKTLTLNNLRLE